MDRKIAPITNKISTLDFLYPEKWKLSNGVEVFGVNAGSQELVKIDFIFEAGTWYQSKNLIAGLTNAFMNQGTKRYVAQEIAEVFDFRGAYVQLVADQQFGNVSILTLNKYLDEIIEVTADIIKSPTFPEKELNAQLIKKKQQFVIENDKVKTLAQKKFSQVILGADHPYSNSNKIEDYDSITTDDLKEFHQQNYSPKSCKIVVAGKYDDRLKNLLEQYFGANSWGSISTQSVLRFEVDSDRQLKHKVQKEDALQSAIRMGKLMPNRKDADFHSLNVLATVFGGYFGSRLMTNIREDKGYTYGIGAGIYTWPRVSYLSVSTEVGTDVTEAALKEIYYEMEKLQNDLVGENELNVVKSFLLGEHLRSFDGVFAMSNSLRTLIEGDVWYDHFDKFIEVVNNIGAQELRELGQKYFSTDGLFEVVAGKFQ